MVPRSEFPYDEVQGYIHTPGAAFEFGGRYFLVETLGMPATDNELIKNARQVYIDRKLRVRGYRQTEDAVIHERIWDRAMKERKWELLKRWLNLAVLMVAAETHRPPNMPPGLNLVDIVGLEVLYVTYATHELRELIGRSTPGHPRFWRWILGNGAIISMTLISYILRYFVSPGFRALVTMWQAGDMVLANHLREQGGAC